MKVRCIEQLQTKQVTFRPGEEYTSNEVNKRWWIVDSVGIETEEFNLHFEVLEDEVITEKEASKVMGETVYRMVFYPEPDITLGWLDGEEEHEDVETLWDKVMDYIFV